MELGIGREPVVGVGDCYILLDDIVEALHARGLHYLVQVGKGSPTRTRDVG